MDTYRNPIGKDGPNSGLDDPQALQYVAEQGVSVHTGFPNPATDKRLRSLDFNQLLVSHPSSTFIFRIRGRQGESSGIFDGDVAVIDRAPSPRPTDFVLWHDGHSFNLSRPARIAPDGTMWGVVTAIIHVYRQANA